MARIYRMSYWSSSQCRSHSAKINPSKRYAAPSCREKAPVTKCQKCQISQTEDPSHNPQLRRANHCRGLFGKVSRRWFFPEKRHLDFSKTFFAGFDQSFWEIVNFFFFFRFEGLTQNVMITAKFKFLGEQIRRLQVSYSLGDHQASRN